MANQIVTVNVTVNSAPTPSNLQKMGAFVSMGGTTLTPGTFQFLPVPSSLAAILTGAAAVTSITQSAGLATVTTTAPHGLPTSEEIEVTIAGATPAAYNGSFVVTVTGASTFTYAIASGTSSPATGTIKWTPEDVGELVEMNTTFFAQGGSQGVYVLELGEGDPADGVTALTTFITDSPGTFYSYLFPRNWDNVESFLTFLGNYTNPNSKTYFFVTTATDTYTNYTAAMKDVFLFLEAPAIGGTEFSAASAFYVTLNYTPSPTNKITPTAFAFLYGVTPYPTTGNATLLASLKAANVNYVGLGNEGGLSNLLLFWGKLQDGNDFSWWYSVDWVQINLETFLANAVINGSNNPINPLYYDQNGINTLEGVAAGVMSSGVSNGLVLGNVQQLELDPTTLQQQIGSGALQGFATVNAIPFQTYLNANPGDFKLEKYAGLSVIYSPNRGFTQIIINVLVTDFAA